IPSDVVRREQCLFCAVDVAPAQANASELDERPAELTADIRPELVARHRELVLGVFELPAQAEDLTAMDATTPVDAADRIARGPTLHRVRPLFREVVLRESLQRAHELAVHDARREWIELAGGRRDTGLFEKSEPLVDFARDDEPARFGYAPDCGRCGI